ncbi:hypothetical protein M569_08984, partial [Genlisea aurea]
DGSRSSSIASTKTPPPQAKSCKGCLYYSSRLKSDSRNPICVGLTRSLPEVPQYIVGQTEMEATKEGRSITDFRYACVGYSLYTDRKKQSISSPENQTELPICIGLEMIVDRRVAGAPLHDRDDGHGLPQQQHRSPPKPPNSATGDYLSRFRRNAQLVANGVEKNVRKVGNQIKQSLDEILDRRPK